MSVQPTPEFIVIADKWIRISEIESVHACRNLRIRMKSGALFEITCTAAVQKSFCDSLAPPLNVLSIS